MMDVYSHGRPEVDFVRGMPYGVPASNYWPTRMMERFWEAYDLILKPLTQSRRAV